MANVPNPAAASVSKNFAGVSDTDINDSGSLLMFNSLVTSFSMNTGFSGSSSSLSITVVEDPNNGYTFSKPSIPSVIGFSVPKGGVGRPVVFSSDTISSLSTSKSELLQPASSYDQNVPFYFSGIVSSVSETEVSSSGKTNEIRINDPREILRGCQCLLGGFALSQEINSGTGRYANVTNVIDVFGYYTNGFDSNRNRFGMTWDSIKTAIEQTQVTMYGIEFEFHFTGSAFTSAPSYYRVQDETIDIVSLAEKVAADGSADIVVIGRKVNSSKILVEFKAVSKTSSNAITEAEINSFISSRSSIVNNAVKNEEFSNEATSGIIIGGSENSNYVAYPTPYDSTIHTREINNTDVEDYELWPDDIKTRLFKENDTGSIFPYWGMHPENAHTPMAEPFIPLDHLAFSDIEGSHFDFQNNIPWVQLSVSSLTVRNTTTPFSHDEIFLDGDDDSDSRPFGIVSGYNIQSSKPSGDGWIKGLPVNTEVLRAALKGPDAFFLTYSLYYEDIAKNLGLRSFDWKQLLSHLQGIDDYEDKKINFDDYWANPDGNGDWQDFAALCSFTQLAAQAHLILMKLFETLSLRIYNIVLDYAEKYMGRSFLVCLPRSEIMNRIFNDESVPTDPLAPEIEYVVNDRGYWKVLPSELNPDDPSHNALDSENAAAIKERFEEEDGRFRAMAFMDWQPEGNASFNSNGMNKAMFVSENGGLGVSDFRPNKVSEGNAKYVAIACSVTQLTRRPDLAIVELPGTVNFDPTDNVTTENLMGTNSPDAGDDEYLISAKVFIDAMKRAAAKNDDAAEALSIIGVDKIEQWAKSFVDGSLEIEQTKTNIEPIMDLKAVIIPLTSTWSHYGPWYQESGSVSGDDGMQEIIVDSSLVPWEFVRPVPPVDPYINLNAAGQERLDATITNLTTIHTAQINVAGFPEVGPINISEFSGSGAANLTGMSCSFSTGGVTTSYDFSTYIRVPGTYRKTEIQKTANANRNTRQRPDTVNINLFAESGVVPRYQQSNFFDRTQS